MYILDQTFKQQTWYVLLSLTLLIVMSAILVLATTFVLVVITGIILAVLALSLIKFLERQLPLPRWGNFVLTWLLIIGVPIVLIAFTFPSLQTQFADFGARINMGEISDSVVGNIPGFDFLLEELSKEDIVRSLQNGVLSGQLGGIATSALTAVVGFFLFLFIGIYGSLDPAMYRRETNRLFPSHWTAVGERYYPILENTLSRWIVGRLLSMAVVTMLTYVGLILIGLDLAFLLAVLAGLLSFIPNIGPILSFVPALFVAFSQDPALILWVAGLYLSVQIIESYVITPFIQQWSVNIPPAALLVVQALFGVLFGILGVLLAEPFLALLIAFLALKEKAGQNLVGSE